MSDHTITWTHRGDAVVGAFSCHASEGAKCRLVCAGHCESWTLDHVHALVDGGECQAKLFLEACDLEESYEGARDVPARSGPVKVCWDGDTYLWEYADQPATVLDEVAAERERQNAKWGEQNHPDGTGTNYWRRAAERYRANCDRAAKAGTVTWLDILREEVYEALAESDPAKLRAELVQVAAVATQWVGAIDRRTTGETP